MNYSHRSTEVDLSVVHNTPTVGASLTGPHRKWRPPLDSYLDEGFDLLISRCLFFLLRGLPLSSIFCACVILPSFFNSAASIRSLLMGLDKFIF